MSYALDFLFWEHFEDSDVEISQFNDLFIY